MEGAGPNFQTDGKFSFFSASLYVWSGANWLIFYSVGLSLLIASYLHMTELWTLV
jgi:hypothetical protein